MDSMIQNLLDGKYQNHIMPFFWQHGEEETVLRKYMEVIHNCGIGAVCVESRPHPDFCGDKWWQDMDVILDEARKHDMKVWILDDSHFPTGYANGALENAPEELCRQGICYKGKRIKGGRKVSLSIEKFLNRKNNIMSIFDVLASVGKKKRVFSKDTILSVTAVNVSNSGIQESVDLTSMIIDGKLHWNAPEGEWQIGMCKLSGNCGAHRNYINMMNPDSCRILLDAVYEPHYTHYREEFGKTIAGFFSDEPELGNGKMYSNETLGKDQDLPWSHLLVQELENSLGEDWKNSLLYLWENDLDAARTARIRYVYMDAVTKSVQRAFSEQIGNWCRARGVEYIGHMIEDNNGHARTGGSLGHYFRGLAGQDMAGIDDIGGQVMPQGEDKPDRFMRFQKRDGEFYHFILGKLGPSLAAIDEKKQGCTMCEIFGNYGWAEGLRLEKYLADHFMVNGVNHFVPHAFSPKAFPDPDCPPHFYAHGRNPQYRHFSSLMGYMNRVCELISGGRHKAPAALLYHGEAEWTGKAMMMQKPARKLLEAQIDFDIIPTDVFRDREYYHTCLEREFRVQAQTYRAFVIPYAQFISGTLAEAIARLSRLGIPVLFVDSLPDGFYEGEGDLHSLAKHSETVPLERLTAVLTQKGIHEIKLEPADNNIRYLHYKKESDIYYLINEGTEVYKGTLEIPQVGEMYAYQAWDNVLEEVKKIQSQEKSWIDLELEPLQSFILIVDEAGCCSVRKPLQSVEKEGKEIAFSCEWKRSLCDSSSYPQFGREREVMLPDHLAEENPGFSGWVRYENRIHVSGIGKTVLTISDAYEGVEVFINGVSAGVQVVPTYRFDISELVKHGENDVVIEVSTTLERERAAAKNQAMTEKLMRNKVLAPTGITGVVKVFEQN